MSRLSHGAPPIASTQGRATWIWATASATKFVEEHSSKVLIGVLAIVVVIVVVMMIGRSQRATETVAAGELATATQTMNAGMHAQAADQLQAEVAAALARA